MHHGTIRNAALHDADEIARLAHREVELVELLAHGHLLVLDLHHGALGGVVHVDETGAVDLLAVEPALTAEEERMASVAHAMSIAMHERDDDRVRERDDDRSGRWATVGHAFCVALQAG